MRRRADADDGGIARVPAADPLPRADLRARTHAPRAARRGARGNIGIGTGVAVVAVLVVRSLARALTARGGGGVQDYGECSMAFLYLLSTMALRQNLQKALGFAVPALGPPPSMFGAAASAR
eukprot:scaffold3445_cov193-Prasinococcus_capsulatus_cf.AAC.1